MQSSIVMLKMGKFCKLVKMHMFRALKNQLLDVQQKCLTPQKTDIDLNI